MACRIDNFYFSILKFSTLQAKTYKGTIYKNGSRAKAMLFISRVLIKDVLITIFSNGFHRETKITPLNKDHDATYHQGEVSTVEAIFRGLYPFLSKPPKICKN